jgi:uncharacterized protein GlcG (DUF336 family)
MAGIGASSSLPDDTGSADDLPPYPDRGARSEQPAGSAVFGIHVSNRGRVMTFAGGVPLRRDESIIGAIGVSGGSGSQDEAVALAGASAVAG